MSLNDFYYEKTTDGYRITGLKNEDLNDVDIPEGVTSIGKEAFANTDIEAVRFPKSLVSIDDSAFWLCQELTTIYFPKDGKLTSIGEYSFASCTSLEYIFLPPTLRSIDAYAFFGCESLISIAIPASVIVMRACVFEECYNLEQIVVERGSIHPNWHTCWNESDADVVFEHGIEHKKRPPNPKKLEEIRFAELAKSVFADEEDDEEIEEEDYDEDYDEEPHSLLGDFSNISGIEWEDEFEGIGDDLEEEENEEDDEAFANLVADTSKNTKNKYFGYDDDDEDFLDDDEDFKEFSDIEGIEWEDEFEDIDTDNEPSGFSSKNSYSSDDELEPYVLDRFEDGYKIVGLKNPNTVIKTLVIPKSVQAIGYEAFVGMHSIEKIVLHPNVKIIYDKAFEHCSGLKSVEIYPKTAVLKGVFNGAKALEEFHISSYVYEGALYNSGVRRVTFEDGLSTIRASILSTCRYLESVSLPDSVTYISAHAFEHCASLKSVHLSPNIDYIETGAFMYCFCLEHITLPENLSWIMEKAFFNCRSLKSITFNNKLGTIKSEAFAFCSSLTSVRIPKSVYSVEKHAFPGTLKEVIIEKSSSAPCKIPAGWDKDWIDDPCGVKIRYVDVD